MDLPLYLRVLSRHRTVLIAGFVVAVLLATLSYYRVDTSGIVPKLTPRKAEVWQSQANVFLTQQGFPAGSQRKFTDAARFTGLASLYAQLAQSDQVRARIEKTGGRLDGAFEAIPVVDNTSGPSPLPLVALFGKAGTRAEARTTLERGLAGFIGYVKSSQEAAGIPAKQRIELSILNAPSQAILIEPRKKTLPVVVFLAILMASIAVVFILENSRRGRIMGDAESLPKLRSPELASEAQRRSPERAADGTPDLKPTPVPEPEPEVELEPETTRVRRWA